MYCFAGEMPTLHKHRQGYVKPDAAPPQCQKKSDLAYIQTTSKYRANVK